MCELAKHRRISYPSIPCVASKLFALIHSDVWGPSRTTSYTGKKWFLTLIDDHSRVCCVYILKAKFEVATVFQNFHSMIKTHYQANIQKVIMEVNFLTQFWETILLNMEFVC